MVERAIDILIRGKDASAAAFGSAARVAASFGNAIKGTTKALRDLSIVGIAAGKAVKNAGAAILGSLDAAEGQLKAETRLAVALSRHTKEIDKNLDAYRKWSSELQNATGIQDDLSLSIAASLQATGAAPAVVRRATQAILDFGAATDLGTAGPLEALRKSLSGASAQWSRMGLVIDQTLSPQRQALQAIEQLERAHGGTARMIGETAYGSVQRFKVALDDLKETFGLAIIKTDVFHNVLGLLGAAFGEINQETRANQLASGIDKVFRKIGEAVQFVVNGLIDFGAVLVRVAGYALLAIGKLTQGFGALLQGLSGLKILGAEIIPDLGMLPGVVRGAGEGLEHAASQMFSFADGAGSAKEKVSAFLAELLKFNANAAQLRQGGSGVQPRDQGGGGFRLGGPGLSGDLQQSIANLGASGTTPIAKLLELVRQLREQLGYLPFDLELIATATETFSNELSSAFASITDSVANGMGTLLVDLKDKAISAGEAVRKFGNSVVNQALASMGRAITKIILAPLDLVLQKLVEFATQLLFGAALEKSLMAAAAAAQLAIVLPTAAAIAAAWLPAAMLASIATLGGAAGSGATSFTTSLAAMKGAALSLSVPGAAEGAFVGGPQLLQVGEGRYKETVQPLRPGSAMELLSRANAADEFFGAGAPTIGTLNLTVNGNSENPEQLARIISQEIARELRLLAGRRFS